jgi:hypothetical protein
MSDEAERSDEDRDQFGVCCICAGRYERINSFYDDDGLCPACGEGETA